MTRALLIPADPNKAIEILEVAGLESLQEQVGGYIEGLSLPCGLFAYINAEGKFIDLPRNSRADKLLRELDVRLASDDCIAGNMLVLGAVDEGGEDTDFPERLVNQFVSVLG